MATVSTISMAYNSVYLVEEGGERVLVDAGPDYAGAQAVIEHGTHPVRPDFVAITHGHIDHAGLGAYWSGRGVPVAMAAADVHLAAGPALANPAEWAIMSGYVDECGAPPEVAAAALHGLEQRRTWAEQAANDEAYHVGGRDGRWPTALHYRPFTPAQLLNDGFRTGAGLRVVACPGHTPGNVVLVHEDEGWLFSGDQLLPTITPTPAIQMDVTGEHTRRFHSLPHFVASLRTLRAMRFARCFPGHGEPFDNVTGVIDANLAQVEQRSVRVEAALRAAGEASAYTLAEALYPRALGRRFWQIIATVQGQLDLLEREGRALQHGKLWTLAR